MPSVVQPPGQPLTLTCKVSGYSVTDRSYCTHWIRQPAGEALEWIGEVCGSGNLYHSEKLKNKFSVSRDTSSSSQAYLQMNNLRSEDTALYYCGQTPTVREEPGEQNKNHNTQSSPPKQRNTKARVDAFCLKLTVFADY
uniref:Ig-like domain-containing protein n=1 Tax=Denticeps clupeoides TaxID=299321 RepID=A0AAY4C7T1_9TELE